MVVKMHCGIVLGDEFTAMLKIRSPKPRLFKKLDSAIQRINHYPADNNTGYQLHYPVDRDSVIHLLNNWGLDYFCIIS